MVATLDSGTKCKNLHLFLFCQEEAITEEDHVNNLQWAFVENCSTEFVGRRQLVHQIVAKINSKDSGILGVVGKSGSGKTALMVSSTSTVVLKTENQYPVISCPLISCFVLTLEASSFDGHWFDRPHWCLDLSLSVKN